MDRGNLADLTAFVAVADRLSFRAAACSSGSRHRRSAIRCGSWRSASGCACSSHDARVAVTDGRLAAIEQLRPAMHRIAGAIEQLNETRHGRWGAADLRAAFGGGGSHRTDLGTLLSTYPESIWSSRWARRRSTSWRRDSTPGLRRASGGGDMIAVR